ncbi:MAG: hypothetical protein K9G41_02735 [Flavobacteriales bacterium]|nr:hypothetical protein [Flavobacteriales bacterium]
MKYILASLLLSVANSCTEESITDSAPNAELCRSILINPDLAYNHEYDLTLSIEDAGNGEYKLASVIDFHNGAYTASPLSNNNFTGAFKVTFHHNDNLTTDDSIEEIPRSVEKIDLFGNLVSWVNEKTTYKKKLKLKSEQDFKVSGVVSFTIEPTCTFEEIPFDIFYINGELRVQQYPKLDKTTCSNPRVLKTSMYESPLIDHEIAKNHPYDVDFKIEKTSGGQYKLVTIMQLFGGSFYVSPHSTMNFKGRFTIEIAPNNNLSIGSSFVETPHSETVIDPHQFVHGPVNWVTKNTRYDHSLQLHTEDDFEIGGKLIFVIEPKCTLEEVPILFKYKNGVLTVEKWKC